MIYSVSGYMVISIGWYKLVNTSTCLGPPHSDHIQEIFTNVNSIVVKVIAVLGTCQEMNISIQHLTCDVPTECLLGFPSYLLFI